MLQQKGLQPRSLGDSLDIADNIVQTMNESLDVLKPKGTATKYHSHVLKVQYGFQSMCKQTCKYLVRCTLYISMYLLIFGLTPNTINADQYL